MPPSAPRVVCTGLGAITPLGLTLATTWEALLMGRSGVDWLEGVEVHGLPPLAGGQVRGFRAEEHIPGQEVHKTDRFIQFAHGAANEALADAEIAGGTVAAERAAVIFGCGRGGLPAVEQAAARYQARGGRGVSPHFSVLTLANMAAGQIARAFGFTGPCLGIATACASGTHAIAEAAHLIRRGEADMVVTGGTEAVITPLMLAGFHQAKVLASAGDDPSRACRPFDRSRSGFVLGEGACCLVLETETHARARGARIYGELAGSGMTCDAYHPTTPDPAGRALARAIRSALDAAGVTPQDLGYISAHGTGTLHNDPTEARALHLAVGATAEVVPISSIKGATGHMLGASGALEAAVCLLAMRDGMAPATTNLVDPDPACPLAHIVGAPARGPFRVVLSHSAGFGGVNAALVFRG
jgi:3-oxoacyl-[acyl-carrier-protein] synthase II